MKVAICYDVDMTTHTIKNVAHNVILERQDIIWGPVEVPEFSMRIGSPRRIRFKSYNRMSTADFCKHINMRRKNIPQNLKWVDRYEVKFDELAN